MRISQVANRMAPLAVAVALAIGSPTVAHAAAITFGAGTTVNADTDVLNGGLLHTAYNGSNSTQTVNGVQFLGSNSGTAWGSNLTWGSLGSNNTSAFDDGGWGTFTGSTAYRAILTGASYNGGAAATGTISGLTSGRVYAVQFWVNDTRVSNRTQTITSTGGNTITLDYNSTDAAGGVGQYTIGTFTADAATQTFTFDSVGGTGTSSQVNAIQVRDITELKGIWTGLNGTAWNNTNANAFATNNFGAALTTDNFANAKTATGGYVTFTDSYYNGTTGVAATNTSVVVDAAGVSATNVYFDNNSLNFTFTNASGTTGITSTTALRKRGSGTVTLASANTHTGGNFISGGTLIVASNAALGGTNNNTTISTGGTLQPSANITLASGHTITANGGTINGNGFGFTINTANFLTGSGALNITGSSSTNSVLTISNASQNISGPITISSGRIATSGTASNPLGTGDITIGTGTASLYVQGGHTWSNNISLSTQGGENRGAIRLQGGGNTFNGQITSTSGSGIISADQAVTNTFNGSLVTTSANMLQFGGATNNNASAVYDVNGTSPNFLGIFSIGAGTTDVASFADYGTASAIGNRSLASETASGNGIGIRIAGGTLRYTGSTAQSTNRQIRLLNSANNTIDASGANINATLSFTHTGANINLFDSVGTRTLNLIGSNAGDNTFAIKLEDQSTNATSLVKNGAGKWVLSATDSTFTGNVTVTQGILEIEHSNSLGVGPKNVLLTNGTSGNPQLHLDGSGGDISLAANISFQTSNQTSGAIRNKAGDNVINGNFTLTSGGGSTHLYSDADSITFNGSFTPNIDGRELHLRGVATGIINGNILDGTGLNTLAALRKRDAGTWTINSTGNTYTGSTFVEGGKLLINGAIAGSGVTVSSGATLGGTGAINTGVIVNGILSPGASIESLASGALTMNSGSTFVFEAANNSSTGADLMAVDGALSLTNVTLDLTNADLDAIGWLVGNKLTLISYDGTAITSGFAGYDNNTIYTFGANQWLFKYNDLSAGNNYQTEAQATGTVFVTMTLVPEPSSLAMLVFGMITLWLFKKRKV